MRTPQKQQYQELLQFRLARAQRQLESLHRTEDRFPWYRLVALLAGALIAYFGFQLLPPLLAWLVAALAVAFFLWLAGRHRRVIQRIGQLETFCHLLATHVARLNLDWDRIPPPAEIKIAPDHPFADDLNLCGPRSLHQLLDTCVSQGGSQRLADWLTNLVPDPQQITQRQQMVRELLGLPAFRVRLEIDGLMAHPDRSPRWDTSALLRWFQGSAAVSPEGMTRRKLDSLRPMLILLSVLAVTNFVLLVLNLVGLIPPVWIATFLVYLGLQSLRYRETSSVFDESYGLARTLGDLLHILADLEDYPFPAGSRLAELAQPVTQGVQMRPSAALRRIGWIISFSSLHGNPFLSLLLNFLVPWDMFFAYQLERYKEDLRSDLPRWLDTWYQLEALTSLANAAAFNPGDTFPEIVPPGSQPVFQAVAVGHPLIPDATRVTNDFTLQSLGEVDIITGSNMSGKSTFLRTLGVNLALAYAGGVVTARSLRVLPFRLYTSMNLADSLSDGVSLFYAEVRRLKGLLDQLDPNQPYPLFFLIDEIFRGTNNRERQIGSQAYSQALAGKNGAGLISTHDLELAHLADSNPWVHNFHFREEIQDGQMVFDFKIRPGASPTTNALRIMALAGLPVPQETPPGPDFNATAT